MFKVQFVFVACISLTFATSSPQRVYSGEKNASLASIFRFNECSKIDIFPLFFLRFVFVMKCSSSQSCVMLFIFPSIFTSTFSVSFQNVKRNFSYFNSFSAINQRKKGKTKIYDLPGKISIFFPSSLRFEMFTPIFNLQQKKKEKNKF